MGLPVRNIEGPPAYPVKGSVLVDGRPVRGVMLDFVPEGGPPSNANDSNIPVASGVTDENGNYFLSTYETGDGACAGKFNVTLSMRDPDEPLDTEPLDPRFTNPKSSGIVVEIVEGENELDPIQVFKKKLAPPGT